MSRLAAGALWRRLVGRHQPPADAGAAEAPPESPAPPVPALPDLAALVESEQGLWDEAVAHRGADAPRILVATSGGGHLACASLEGVLAAALVLRNADVHVLLCDGVLPACLECDYARYPDFARFAETGPQEDRCDSCFAPARDMYGLPGITLHRYGDFLTAQDREEARRYASELSKDEMVSFVDGSVRLGEHALAGALRFFARGELDSEEHGEAILRRYFESALLTQKVTQRLLTDHPMDVAVFNHGIYVPQGIIGDVARACGVRVVNWNPAYRKQCFIFSEGDTYHHTLMNESVSEWESVPWTPALRARTEQYLDSRWKGTNDWIWFHDEPELAIEAIEQEIGIDFGKRPTVGLLTNVIWDAQLHYPANAFPTMVDWLIKTVEYFASRDDCQLIIRVHPAEVRGGLPSRQAVVDEIEKAFPQLPENVYVVPPESNVSTYVAMAACDSVIIYGTKTGVELTSMGIPVVVAGEAWIRNKGLTYDASSCADYLRILDTLPLGQRLSEAQVERALKYAFHFFMRRMIPFEFMTPTDSWPPYAMGPEESLRSLARGASAGLDVVCEGILATGRFVYPAETEGWSST